MFRKHFPLLLIIFLAIFLRFYNLDVNPPDIHSDEISTEYSAYSVLKTGLDMAGKQEILRFADLNSSVASQNGNGTFPSLYSWILIPFVSVLGLHAYVDRLPSAIFGLVAIIAFYYIVNKLTKNNVIGIVAALLLALNPGAIQFSRAGLLESLPLGLVLSGIAFFLGASTRPVCYLFAAICFSLSLFSYDSPRLFLPPFLTILTIYQFQYVAKARKIFIFACGIFVLFYGVFLCQTLLNGEIVEYEKSSIINIAKITEQVNQERTLTTAPLWLSSVFHNKATVPYKNLLTNYVSIFSVNWLYINGMGNQQQSVSNHGQYYIFELPFALIGFYYIFRRWRKLGFLLIAWIIIGVLPGGLSTSNNVYRNNMFLPVPIVFSATGFVVFWNYLMKFSGWRLLSLRIGIILFISAAIASYLFTYFFDYPIYSSPWWAKPQNDAVKFAMQQKSNYKSIFIDGGESLAMEYAYFAQLDPKIFQDAHNNKQIYNNAQVMKIDNFMFGNFDLNPKSNLSVLFPKDSLVITYVKNFPEAKVVKIFYDPRGVETVFKAFEIK
jgi:4-amino-4-deoxy-L-arabinose transferase-like glycosyltransferase